MHIRMKFYRWNSYLNKRALPSRLTLTKCFSLLQTWFKYAMFVRFQYFHSKGLSNCFENVLFCLMCYAVYNICERKLGTDMSHNALYTKDCRGICKGCKNKRNNAQKLQKSMFLQKRLLQNINVCNTRFWSRIRLCILQLPGIAFHVSISFVMSVTKRLAEF